MREILFRGQNTFSFNWVTGYYHQDPEDGHFITEFEYVPVAGNIDEPPSGYFNKNITQVTPESIGQFTGLTDKNGTNIFEGDIILYQDAKGEVYYCNDTCMFMAKFKTTHSAWSFDSMDDEIEVVGNIYEI